MRFLKFDPFVNQALDFKLKIISELIITRETTKLELSHIHIY